MVRERHLSTISSTHKVDTTSRCADLSARISPPQRQLLRQLAQIDAKCKSATPETRTIHSISCLLMKAVLILNHSQHTLLASTKAAVILASRSGSDARRTCKNGKIQSLGGCSSIVQHASNGSTLGLLRDRQAVSMQSSIGA